MSKPAAIPIGFFKSLSNIFVFNKLSFSSSLKRFGTRLNFRDEEEIKRARKIGINDLNKIYNLNELASGDVMFAATGVTDGNMLKGVKNKEGFAFTESIVMRSSTQTIRKIKAKHSLKSKL